jgi:hypothetical protein
VVDEDEGDEEEEYLESIEFVKTLHGFLCDPYNGLDDEFEIDLTNTDGTYNTWMSYTYANVAGQYDDKIDFFIRLNKWI